MENHTAWSLQQAVLVGRNDFASIGPLDAGDQREASLIAHGRRLSLSATSEGLDLSNLFSIAASNVQPGERCLVGVIAGPMPGLEIEPATVPAHIANVVVAHLDYGPLEEPQADLHRRPESHPIEDSQ